MNNPRIREIKHAQKESALLHEISQLLVQIAQDNTALQGLTITRVSLSPKKSFCFVYVHALGGIKEYEEKRPQLVLYRASMRKALSKLLHGRYVPDIRFEYDSRLDKERRIDDIIERLKAEGKF